MAGVAYVTAGTAGADTIDRLMPATSLAQAARTSGRLADYDTGHAHAMHANTYFHVALPGITRLSLPHEKE